MPRRPAIVLACLALASGAAVAAGCGSAEDEGGGSSAQAPPPTPAPARAATIASTAAPTGGTPAPVIVSMKASRFVPAAITVKAGQTITWRNDDGYAHNVTASSGAGLASDNIDGGDTFDYSPTTPGTIEYYCTIHAGQDGTITVTE